MKALFISFDGVLKSENSFLKKKKDGHENPDSLCKDALWQLFCLLESVTDLRLILTGPEKSLELRELKVIFKNTPSIIEKIVDSVPTLRGQTRGEEIRRYIMHSSRRISKYAVLDCQSDLSVIDESICFFTDPQTGFTETDRKEIYKCLRY